MKDEALDPNHHHILFGVRRSVRYHMRRVSFYDGWHKVTNVVGIMFGTATVGTIFSQLDPAWPIGASLMVTLAFTVDLFVGTAKMSRLHNDLAKRFIDLEKNMVRQRDHWAKWLAEWEAERLDIEKDEPPVLRTLDILCHNEILRSMGCEDQIHPIPWFHKRLANLISFEPRHA